MSSDMMLLSPERLGRASHPGELSSGPPVFIAAPARPSVPEPVTDNCRIYVWISMVAVTFLFQCLPFATMGSKNTTCLENDTEVSLTLRWLMSSPAYLLPPWYTGACLVYVVSKRHHGVQSRSQRTESIYFCIASFGTSWMHVFMMWSQCSSQSKVSLVFHLFFDVTLFCLVLMWILQSRLSLLRLRVLAPLVPAMATLGELCYWVLVVSIFSGVVLVNSWSRFESVQIQRLLYISMVVCLVSSLFTHTLFNGCLVWLIQLCVRAARREALQLDVDERSARQMVEAARFARYISIVIVSCGISSPLYCLVAIYRFYYLTDNVGRLTLSSVFVVDHGLNVASVLMLSGFVGPEKWHIASTLDVVVASAASQKRREVERRLSEVIGSSAGSALALSSFMEGISAETILDVAVARFRCISWDVLAQHPEIVIDGTPLDGHGCANELFHLSEPCELGGCDAFISHSWSDCSEMKWKAIESWCEDFIWLRGRSPRLWLDKVCVDQSDIQKDLQCLPVFMAGCNTLFVSSGLNYTFRMWCMMEMFVFKSMQSGSGEGDKLVVWLMGKDDEEREQGRYLWRNFDVDKCECFNAEDKVRFLRVVELYPGGPDGFNHFIRSFAEDIDAPIFELL